MAELLIGRKLVRDWVPSLEHPSSITFHVAPVDEMKQLLYAKLTEELQEVMLASGVKCVNLQEESERDENVRDELADVLQVVKSLATHLGVEWEDVLSACEHKASTRGTFSKRFVMTVRPDALPTKRGVT
jgi:predicted house-cleaning noncanonical NTP pyrophosphatase (MazG superfamily)